MSVPEFAPMIMKDNDGWRVSLVRDGRVHVYKCENERDAKRFHDLLSKPPMDPPSRRYIPKRQERQNNFFARIQVMAPPRWANVHI
ncbi:MAG: hypothetical protein ACJ790_08600 [Myxococcaceae bacterium]